MAFKIGVFASSSGDYGREVEEKARIIGEEIAKTGNILISGATFGLPGEAVIAANEADGMTVGYSPAKDEKEHIEVYKYPTTCKKIIYTGKGVPGRNIDNVENCDGCVIISGGIGTLHEFCVAYRLEKVIGVLTNSGGVSDIIENIVNSLTRKRNAKIVYDNNPKELVKKVLEGLK